MIKKQILCLLMGLLVLSSCDTGGGDDATGQDVPHPPKPPVVEFKWGVQGVYDFNFNDFGEHKTEVKQAIPTAVKDEEDFLYISSVNDHGMMVGDVYFPIVGYPGYFAGYPVAIKFDETSHKFSSSIETQDIDNDQWGLFPLFYQFFNYVANPDANGKSSVYLAASFPLDQEAPYTHFATFLTEYVYDSNSQQGKISNQQTVSTFDTTKAIAEELHASPDGSYIFTAPAYYIDKSTPTVAMSRVFKNANNTRSKITMQYDQNYFHEKGDKWLFQGPGDDMSNNHIFIGFDANPASCDQDGCKFSALVICKVNDTTLVASCHMLTDFYVNNVERSNTAKIAPNGQYIYAVQRTTASKTGEKQLVTIDPNTYKVSPVKELTGVTRVLQVFDNGSVMVGDSKAAYIYSPTQKAWAPVYSLLTAANIDHPEQYQLMTLSPDGQYFVFMNTKVTEKSDDATAIYKVVKLSKML